MAEIYARLLLVVNSSIISPSFLTIFGTRLNFTAESFFCELFPLLLPHPTAISLNMRGFVIGILFLAKPPNSGTSLMLTGFQHYLSATQRDCSGLILNSVLTELNDGRDDKQ